MPKPGSIEKVQLMTTSIAKTTKRRIIATEVTLALLM